MATLYAIRCTTTGEWYRPSPLKERMWHTEFKRAKIYTQLGHAKSAITSKRQDWDYFAKNCCLPEERQAYKKFLDAEIVPVGEQSTYYNL